MRSGARSAAPLTSFLCSCSSMQTRIPVFSLSNERKIELVVVLELGCRKAGSILRRVEKRLKYGTICCTRAEIQGTWMNGTN